LFISCSFYFLPKGSGLHVAERGRGGISGSNHILAFLSSDLLFVLFLFFTKKSLFVCAFFLPPIFCIRYPPIRLYLVSSCFYLSYFLFLHSMTGQKRFNLQGTPCFSQPSFHKSHSKIISFDCRAWQWAWFTGYTKNEPIRYPSRLLPKIFITII